MKIEVQVSYHPSGNRTLMYREHGKQTWVDVQEESLMTCKDEAKFYRAVANWLAEKSTTGCEIQSYRDSSN